MRALTLFLVLSFFFLEIINAQSLKNQNWTYIPIDSTKQKWGDWNDPDWLRYFGLDFCDVNRDGNIDIISGRYIYHNPGGTMEGLWQRTVLDDNVDAIFSIDTDGDQYSDIIAQALPDIYWYEAINEQGTRYKRTAIASIPATSHVNSQGFEKAQILPGGPTELLIAGNGNIYCISIPAQIQSSEQWPTYLIAINTSDEGIGVGDIDGDGDLDIACGRRPEGEGEPKILVWFENPGSIEHPWEDHVVGFTENAIDRVEIADLTGDGHVEIIISEERYPGLEPDGYLYWFSRKENIYVEWEKHVIVRQYSMNNLDIADIDNDGDIDIITNEHKGPGLELQLWENDGKANFTKHILDTGKENHLGTQFIDLDGDGDLDIAGCAWDYFNRMHVWRNDAIKPVKPGSIFREYRWVPPESTDAGKFLRVGGNLNYLTSPDHFPPENLKDGFIRLADSIDLSGATYAELVIERLQSHEDTKGLKIQINNNEWIPVHDPPRIPNPATDYMFHFYPKINIPLDHIESGFVDFKLEVDEHQKWNWPQNLIYGLVFRIYYENEKGELNARIGGIDNNSKIGNEQKLQIFSDQLSDIKKVDYIGFYEDVNWQGDGIYQQWQYHIHMAKIRNHIGGSNTPPFIVNWDTHWLPDQDQEMKIMARVEAKNGLMYLTEAVEGLKLTRDYSVHLIKPFQQPGNWVTRAGEFSEYFNLPIKPQYISQANLYWRSWSPCYSEGIKLNNKVIIEKENWPCYEYFEHIKKLQDISILKKGQNTLTTLKTPLHNGQMVHGMEVQWPGIMMKIKFKKEKKMLDTTLMDYEGKPHFVIKTSKLTYYFDIEGGGFSRIIDEFGNDWISFKRNPWNQYPASAGSSFRGLPNLVFNGDDAGAGHPGHYKCKSWVEGNKIVTETKSGKWKWSWEFFDDHAILDIITTDPEQTYWFLYEGTPGGKFKPGDYYYGTENDGPFQEQHDFFNSGAMFDQFQWMYAGNTNSKNVFYIIQMQKDAHNDLISYLGNSEEGIKSKNGMTVFGFGRDKQTNPLLSKPQKFVIGFYPGRITDAFLHKKFSEFITNKFFKP